MSATFFVSPQLRICKLTRVLAQLWLLSSVFILSKNKSNMADACDSVPLLRQDIPSLTFYQFSYKQPMNPHMRGIINRHQTFVESKNWHRERIAADPKLIADAGFYYLGDRD